MKIAVAGTGYVGLSMAILLAQHNTVKAVDIIPEKVEMLNTFYASVFTAKTLPRDFWTLEGRKRFKEMESFCLVEEEMVQEHLGGISVHKSMGPDEMHPCVPWGAGRGDC